MCLGIFPFHLEAKDNSTTDQHGLHGQNKIGKTPGEALNMSLVLKGTAFRTRCRALRTEPIPILVRRGYFSFLALLNFLAASFASHYNWLDAARGESARV